MLLIALVSVAACQSERQPTLHAGELDLRQWNFSGNSELNLHGPWHFYPQMLVTYPPPPGQRTMQLPGTWNGQPDAQGVKMGGPGFATFALTLRLPTHEVAKPLAVRLEFMLTAYELTGNGQMICSNGRVSSRAEQHRPYYVPCTGILPPPDPSGNVRLLLRVSNFQHRRGGPRGSIILGQNSHLQERELRHIALDVFLCAALVVVGLYYLLLFGHRRSQPEFLVFALTCFAMALRTACLEEMLIVRFFPTIPWELFIRVIFATAYALPPLIFGFFRLVFPEIFGKRALAVYVTLSALLAASLLLPIRYGSWGILLISPLILANVLHVCTNLARLTRSGTKLAGLQLLGMTLMLVFMLNDMLHDLQIVRTGYYASVGMFLFMSCEGIVLSLRYTRAFTTVEKLYADLRDHQAAELELLELNRSKDRFLSIISHDLHGPFGAIYDSLRHLRQRGDNLSRADLAAAIEDIERAGHGVYRLIDNLLKWACSRMGQMPYEPRKIAVRELLEENTAVFHPTLRAKDIRLELDVSAETTCRADPRMLATIVRNLISNALKFTPSGGAITVRMIRGAHRTVHLVVTDSGIGMSKELRDHLESVGSIPARPGTQGEIGGGLGLALCRELATRLGASLFIESEVGSGTSVTLELRD